MRAELVFVAVTDHDFVNRAASKALQMAGIATCEAVEVSARDHLAGHSLHILCYAKTLSRTLEQLIQPVTADRGGWSLRFELLSENGFVADHSAFLDWKAQNEVGLAVTGRRHVRRYLWEEPRNIARASVLIAEENARRHLHGGPTIQASTAREYWAVFMARNAPLGAVSGANRPGPTVSLDDLAAVARESGALLSIAHPNISFRNHGGPNGWRGRLDRYAALGIGGVELNPFADDQWVRTIEEEAAARNLIVTFGSDFHGRRDSAHGLLGELHRGTANREWYGINVQRFAEAVGAKQLLRRGQVSDPRRLVSSLFDDLADV